MTFVTLSPLGAFLLRTGGEFAPDDEGDVEEDARAKVPVLPMVGLTARDDEAVGEVL